VERLGAWIGTSCPKDAPDSLAGHAEETGKAEAKENPRPLTFWVSSQLREDP